jgi:hypothetical protein
MRHMLPGFVILMVCLHFVAPAEAGYVFQLTDSAGVVQDDFVIGSVGQTVDVDVWLKQTDPDTLLTDEGLSFAGVKLTYGSPGIAEVLSVDNIAPNPAFDDPIALLKDVGSNDSALDMAVSDIFSPVFPQSSTPDRIWLGTFTFTALSLGSVQITAMDKPDVDNTLTGLGTALDSQIGSAQATISTVPEPTGLVLLAGLALVAGPYLRRRCR